MQESLHLLNHEYKGFRSSTHTLGEEKVCVLDPNPWLVKMVSTILHISTDMIST